MIFGIYIKTEGWRIPYPPLHWSMKPGLKGNITMFVSETNCGRMEWGGGKIAWGYGEVMGVLKHYNEVSGPVKLGNLFISWGIINRQEKILNYLVIRGQE